MVPEKVISFTRLLCSLSFPTCFKSVCRCGSIRDPGCVRVIGSSEQPSIFGSCVRMSCRLMSCLDMVAESACCCRRAHSPPMRPSPRRTAWALWSQHSQWVLHSVPVCLLTVRHPLPLLLHARVEVGPLACSRRYQLSALAILHGRQLLQKRHRHCEIHVDGNLEPGQAINLKSWGTYCMQNGGILFA